MGSIWYKVVLYNISDIIYTPDQPGMKDIGGTIIYENNAAIGVLDDIAGSVFCRIFVMELIFAVAVRSPSAVYPILKPRAAPVST